MALFLVLEDFTGPATITAGSVIDSGAYDLPTLQASGLALLPYLSTMDGAISAYLSQRGSTPPVKTAEGDLLALLAAGGFLGGGVASVGATSPLASSGGATPDISLTAGGLAGEVLTWDGSAWAGATPAAAGITGLTGDVTASGAGSVAATVARIQGYEVATATPINGNVLAWSAAQSKWVPGAPAAGGGSGGVTLYLNGSTAATAPTTNLPVPSNVPGTIVQELGTTGQVAAANVESLDLTQVPGAYDLVASFVTPPNAPGVTSVPAGLWNFNIWASSSGIANQTVMQVRVYKYDGATAPTLIATSDDVSIYDPAVISQYLLTVVIPAGVTLLATDRLYIELRGRATSNNRRITFQFGDGEPTHVTTTLPSAAGGDLSGTFPNPTVARLQGNAVSSTAPTSNQILQWISGTSQWTPTANGVGLGSKVLLVVEGGAYATIQAAITAAAAHDVILVGPKAVNPADPTETLSWGPAVFSPGKPLTVVGLGGDQVAEAPRVDSVTFDVSSGANILLNTVVIKGLFINSNFSAITAGVNFQGTFPGRLRLQDCFVYNKSVVSGTAVRSANSNASSTFFLDGCVVQTGASTGIGVDHVSGFTSLRGETVIDRFQYALRCAAGTCEMLGARLDGTGAVGEVVRVLGGRVLTTYCTIRNDTANSSGVNLVAAGSVFGAGFSTFTIATGSGYCVDGVVGSVYLHGSVTYSNSAAPGGAFNVKVRSAIAAFAVTQAFTPTA